mgnify:CR=1 FL=1
MKKEALEKIDKIFKIVGESLEGKEKLKNFGFDSYLDLVENAEKSEVSRKKLKAFSDRLDSYFSELNKAFQSSDENYLEFKKSLKELNEKLEADSKVRTAADLIEFRANIDKKLKENDKKKEDEAGKKEDDKKKEDEAEKKENTEEDRSEISKKGRQGFRFIRSENGENNYKDLVIKIKNFVIGVSSLVFAIIVVTAIGGVAITSFSMMLMAICVLSVTGSLIISKKLTSDRMIEWLKGYRRKTEPFWKRMSKSLSEKIILFKGKDKKKSKKNKESEKEKQDTIDTLKEFMTPIKNEEESEKEKQDTIDTLKEFMTPIKNEEELEKEKQDTIDTLKEFMTPKRSEKEEKDKTSEVETPEKVETTEDMKAEESSVEQEDKSIIPEESKTIETDQIEEPVEKEPQLEKVSSEEDLPEQKYRKYFGYVLSLKNEISRMERELATKSGEEYEKLAEQIAVKKGIYKSICKDMSRALTGQYRGENVENFDSIKIDQALNKEEYYSSISSERANAIEKKANKKYNQYLEYALRLRKDLEIMNEELDTRYGSVDPEQRVNDPEYLELKYNRNATHNAYLNVSKRLSQMLTDNQEVVNQEGKSK